MTLLINRSIDKIPVTHKNKASKAHCKYELYLLFIKTLLITAGAYVLRLLFISRTIKPNQTKYD